MERPPDANRRLRVRSIATLPESRCLLPLLQVREGEQNHHLTQSNPAQAGLMRPAARCKPGVNPNRRMGAKHDGKEPEGVARPPAQPSPARVQVLCMGTGGSQPERPPGRPPLDSGQQLNERSSHAAN